MDPRLILLAYAALLLVAGAIIEPAVVQEYARTALLAATAAAFLWAISHAVIHRRDPNARLPNRVVWGMAISWILPTAFLAHEVYQRIGRDALGGPSLLLSLTLVFGLVWLHALSRVRR